MREMLRVAVSFRELAQIALRYVRVPRAKVNFPISSLGATDLGAGLGNRVGHGRSFVGLVTHFFLEGGVFALGVRDWLGFAGSSVAALAGFGSTFGTFEVDGVHGVSLRRVPFAGKSGS